MAFDVTPVYNYLKEHGYVYTIRPWPSHDQRVHLHRAHKWTGDLAYKTMICGDEGEDLLTRTLVSFVNESGFDSVDKWLALLIRMHGEYMTTNKWFIFKVELVK